MTRKTMLKNLRSLAQNDDSSRDESRALAQAIDMIESETHTYTFDSAKAQGVIEISRGNYGTDFKVTAPDGTLYTGFIDLFHFSPGGANELVSYNSLQIVCNPLNDAANGCITGLRLLPNGRIQTFTENVSLGTGAMQL